MIQNNLIIFLMIPKIWPQAQTIYLEQLQIVYGWGKTVIDNIEEIIILLIIIRK
jgi:hypothetical protein